MPHPFNPKMPRSYIPNFTLYEYAGIIHIKNIDVPAGDDVYYDHRSFKCSDVLVSNVISTNMH